MIPSQPKQSIPGKGPCKTLRAFSLLALQGPKELLTTEIFKKFSACSERYSSKLQSILSFHSHHDHCPYLASAILCIFKEEIMRQPSVTIWLTSFCCLIRIFLFSCSRLGEPRFPVNVALLWTVLRCAWIRMCTCLILISTLFAK